MATYYATGTASVANGATAVTGSGTAWVTNGVQAGDYFAANGLRVRISAVNSATSITLATAWPGTSLSGNNYEIQFTPVATRILTQVNTLLASLGNGIVTALAGLSAAADKLPYFTGAASMSLVDFKSWARTFIGSADAATARSNLGANSATNLTTGTLADARLPSRVSESSLDARYVRSADGQPLPTGLVANAARSVLSMSTGVKFFDPCDDTSRWTTLDGSFSAVTSSDSRVGSKLFQATSKGWAQSKERILFDPSALYKITFRVMRYGAAGAAGTFTLGVIGYAADKTTRVNTSGSNSFFSQYYAAGDGLDQSTLTSSVWTEFVGYFKGHAATGVRDAGTIANPSELHEDVRYFSPVFTFNYSTGTSDMRLDSVRVEIVSEEDAAALVNAGSTVINGSKVQHKLTSYTVGTVPSASSSGAGSQIYVSNETGGAVVAFSDGTNWRRVTDRAVIS